ncbi:MAG: RtcB family protein [Leptospiraceae bacterium]|nr:RtcB family protein [Leptospiraceae bacterium]MBL0266745.1 RtcB family protein [Leptospiraceae bacterium]MBP9162007.1 RtcB family protein [Leptospiraceae bacterium]
MAISELQGKTVPVKLWTKLDDVESEALTQLKNIASLPWVFHHVAVMPDVHFGIGATVGSVIAMKDAISPAAVGVDIGCGMGAIRTNLKADALPDSLTEIRNKIEQKIPVGFNEHKQPKVQSRTNSLFAEFRSLHPKVMKLESKAVYQCGTLGGGNHFIELCLDTQNTVWMMLHSGSRNIGKTLAEIHISAAKKLSHNTYLPDRDLAVFLANTPEMESYRRDLFWAQRYALLNRQTMFEIYKTILKGFFPEIKFEEPILCHHNYVSEETHFGENVVVTRKGAISAREGEWGIIPGSMGTKSYIVRGLGNPESFHSASHGAGRRMSRTQAKKNYTLQDLEAQTSGVECRKDGGVLDEIPGAYKNIEEVIHNQKDLVKVEYELKQILCVKG